MSTEMHRVTDELATSRLTHSIIMVDTAMAKRWLSCNVNNRPIRPRTVDRYRDDMVSGRWLLSGDPVRFNVDGELSDGQHRLTALSQCDGLSLPMLVIRGLAREAQSVMDQGVKRTPGDQLGLTGVKNANNIAATARLMATIDDDLMFSDRSNAPSAIRIQDWVSDHPADVNFLQAVLGELRKCEAPTAIAGAAAIILGRQNEVAALTFLTMLARGAGTEGHPINTLDQRLRRLRTTRTVLPDRDIIAMFIQSWNAWRGERRLTQLLRPAGGRWTKSSFPKASR